MAKCLTFFSYGLSLRSWSSTASSYSNTRSAAASAPEDDEAAELDAAAILAREIASANMASCLARIFYSLRAPTPSCMAA